MEPRVRFYWKCFRFDFLFLFHYSIITTPTRPSSLNINKSFYSFYSFFNIFHHFSSVLKFIKSNLCQHYTTIFHLFLPVEVIFSIWSWEKECLIATKIVFVFSVMTNKKEHFAICICCSCNHCTIESAWYEKAPEWLEFAYSVCSPYFFFHFFHHEEKWLDDVGGTWFFFQLDWCVVEGIYCFSNIKCFESCLYHVV